MKKIAILHDAFLYRGGGERLVTLMAEALHADLISGFFSPWSFDPKSLWFTGKIIPLGRPVVRKWFRHLVLKWRFLFAAKVLKNYDTVIFSGDCLDALRHVRRDAKAYYYCHTPPRYLFDFREHYLHHLSPLLRPIFSYAFSIFARRYRGMLKHFSLIMTNSRTVQERLRSYCGYDSTVVYPPVNTDIFSPSEDREESLPYFLSFARLSPPKRVWLIVDAFLWMPDQKLIFTYGKNDPEKDMILTKIHGSPNIIPLESPDDTTLVHLIQHATATLYLAREEDFGMSPVESMACGTPVIGADEGWLRETILDGKTGKLLTISSHEGGVQLLHDTITHTSPRTWHAMKEACIARAEEFSLEKFVKTLQSVLSLSESSWNTLKRSKK